MALLVLFHRSACSVNTTVRTKCLASRLHLQGILSDGHTPTRHLLKSLQTVVRTHRKQCWTAIRSKPNSTNKPCKLTGLLSLGTLSFGVFGFHRYLSPSHHVSCEYKPKKHAGTLGQDDSGSPEPSFSWSEFWNIIWPDVWYFIGAVVSALAVAFVNIQIPLLLGDVTNVLSSYTSSSEGNFLDDIKKPVMKLIYMYGIQGGLTFIYISLLSVMGERVAARLRKDLFNSVISQDIAFFDTNKTGEIVNRLTSDVQDFKSAFKLVISQGLRSITQVAGCVVSLFLMSPKLTGVMCVVVPSIIAVGTAMGSVLRKLSRKAQAQVAKSTAIADEAIGNVRTVRAFAMEPKETEEFGKEVDESARLNTLLGVSIGAFQGLSNIALNGIVLGTLSVGGYLMSTSDIRAGDLMSFMVATQTIQRSLAQLSLLFGQAVRGMTAGARLFDYMRMQPTIPLSGGKIIPRHSLMGNIEFTDVRFTYPTRPNQEVLKGFNLSIPGGRMVALVGMSGGGKSTVAALMERFYDITSGSITVDGVDVRELDLSWLRGRTIGFINQEPVLFATSVMENIRYGRLDATDTEVIEAAKLANAHDFVSDFPEGYNTVLGERGLTVSGGQKQRIAIARALIKNPAILILDEATSALDAESEKVVQEALDNVVRGRTVLVVAHRLSTIRDADMIAVVDGGKVAEAGTHAELKKKKGLYWTLIRKQDNEESSSQGLFSFFRKG